MPTAELPGRRWPSVSVIVVTYNGRTYLDACLQSLLDQDYPSERVEIICVDNASTDGTTDVLRDRFGQVRLLRNDTNTGFSPAVNQAAKVANGEFLALINNDAVADTSWLREAVRVVDGEDQIACAGSKILWHQDADPHDDGLQRLDYTGGQMTFYGHGFAKDAGEIDRGDQVTRPTLFASGGAMVVRRSVFIETGGFDESFFAFFEDVDFGWRLWLLGYEVRYVPRSVVSHHHHGTVERFGYPRERYLLERNALSTVFKNWGDERLSRILPASLLLTFLRSLEAADVTLPDFRITDNDEPISDLQLPAESVAHLAAVHDWALSLDDLRDKRARVQGLRVRDDRELLHLFERSEDPNVLTESFMEALRKVINALDLHEWARATTRTLVLTDAPLDAHMDDWAVRAWEIAHLLATRHVVVLASTHAPERAHPAFTVAHAHPGNIDDLLASAEVVIGTPSVLARFPQVAASDRNLVLDVADTMLLTGLGAHADAPGPTRFDQSRVAVEAVNQHLERADFIVCASEKQRDYWLGQIGGLGRINPATFDADDSLRVLLDVAPFGLPQEPPVANASAIRGVLAGCDEHSTVLLWTDHPAGSDLVGAVRAMAAVVEEHDDVHLVVLPSWGAADSRVHELSAARRAAEELGLTDTNVHIVTGPPSYEQRANYLAEADVGLSLHTGSVEASFAYRPRVLEFLWAGLPSIVTDGDAMAALVTDNDAGLAVDVAGTEGLAEAIGALVTDAEQRTAMGSAAQRLAGRLNWGAMVQPVMDYVTSPVTAPDRQGRAHHYVTTTNVVMTKSPVYYLRRFVEYARERGPLTALIHTRNFVRARLTR